VLGGYTMLGRQVDVVETSRGCTFDCSFCSIIEMRGRNFHAYPVDRVLADIADARSHGAEAIFLVDDNITLDVARFETLCHAIIDAGFDNVDYPCSDNRAARLRRDSRVDAPGGLPLRVSRHQNIRTRTRLSARRAGARATGRTIGGATSNQSGICASTPASQSAASSSGTDDTRESIKPIWHCRRYVDYIQHPRHARDAGDRGFRARG
jgi:hypothetical protein